MTRFYNVFENVTLSVDADIAYVVPQQEQTAAIDAEDQYSFLLVDVYNNGRLIGGKLNITSNYELECNSSSCSIANYRTELYKRSLYGNRETLRDVTMRVAVVVRFYEI